MKIRARDVRKSYGAVTALDGLSLTVPSGATAGILGTNGAGKTTLFRLLIGHERPDAGTLTIGEMDVARAGTAIRSQVGYLPERAGFPPELTGREVLAIHGRIRGIPARTERIERVLSTVGLHAGADRPVGGYSNGMARRLGLATALLADPAVLLLDEPTAGLDPLGVETFRRIVADVGERTDATVVISSHALPLMEEVCDRVAIIDDGRLRTVEDLDRADQGHSGTRTILVRTEGAPTGQLRERCTTHGEVTTEGSRLRVAVPDDRLLEALEDLEGLVGMDAVDLRDRGLAARFEAAVAGEATTPPGEPAGTGAKAPGEGSA